jgi:transcription antitermination factor NusG
LDSDLIIQQFEQIEQKVENLIETCRKVEATNIDLTSQVLKLEEEIQRKQDAENKYQEEKTLVRSKVDGLLAKLNTIAED